VEEIVFYEWKNLPGMTLKMVYLTYRMPTNGKLLFYFSSRDFSLFQSKRISWKPLSLVHKLPTQLFKEQPIRIQSIKFSFLIFLSSELSCHILFKHAFSALKRVWKVDSRFRNRNPLRRNRKVDSRFIDVCGDQYKYFKAIRWSTSNEKLLHKNAM